jgi:WD40 repeat protein
MKVLTSQLERTVTQKQARSDWTHLSFNASGNQILVAGQNGLCLTLDGYEGTLLRSFSSPTAVSAACWTSDDRTILVGNDDGTIACWNVDSGAMVRKLEGHTGAISWVGFNPTYNMFASCDTATAMWVWP